MLRKTILEQLSASSFVAGDLLATRRLALLAPLFAGLPLAVSSSAAKASKLDPAETIITLPDAIRFIPWSGAPAQQRRGRDALRRPGQAGALSRPHEMVSRLHERAAFLRDRSPLARPFRHLVGEQWR
jgi:hypothetical protein